MATWREIRDKARRKVHDTMRVKAIYVPPSGPNQEVFIRVHYKMEPLADMKGTSYDYAERWETVPRIIVLKEDLVPERGGIFSVTAGEAYQVDHVQPDDGITVTAEVSRMEAADTVGLPVP